MTLIDHRYQVLELLGGALTARVFRVYDTLLEQPRVLKCVAGSIESPDAMLLQREFDLLSRVRHPRVVRAYDLGMTTSLDAGASAPPLVYFTLEYVPGDTWRSVLTRPLEVRLASFAELVEAVWVVHQHALRCGDLKPENILLGPNGVQLIDFGLTREVESLEVGRLPTGTLPYMAPELLQGRAGDLRADLFSLGVLLFELLSGAPPFPEADTPSSRLAAWAGLKTPAHALLPESLCSSLSPVLLQLLDRLLTPAPAARPTDAAAVLETLEAASAGSSPASPLPERRPLLAEQAFSGRGSDLDRLVNYYAAAGAEGGRIDVLGAMGSGKSRLLAALAAALVAPARGRVIRLSGQDLPETARAALEHWLFVDGPLAGEAPAWLQGLEQARTAALRGEGPVPALLLDEVPLAERRGVPAGALETSSAAPRPGIWVCRIPVAGTSAADASSGQVLELKGLPESAVRSMIEQASGLVRAPETITRFHHFSEGNPGVLRAILLHPDEMAQPSEALMRLLRPLAEGELEPLSPEAREVARHAALLREPVNVEVLSALVELPRDQVVLWVDELTSNGILVADPAGGTGFGFRRPMVRALLSGELESTRREALHRRAGRILERRLQLGGQVPNAALANHFDLSGDADRARRYLGRALRDATAAGALLEAHDLCQRLLARMPAGDPERTQIYSQLGDINLALQRFPQAEASLAAALATLEDESDADPLILELRIDLLARLARACEERGDFSGARQRLELALKLGGRRRVAGGTDNGDPGKLALALARVTYREGQLPAARAALDRCLEVLEAHPRTGELVEALLLDGLIRMDSGDLEGAAGPFARALELAEGPEHTTGRMRVLHNLHILEARRGNLAGAVTYLQQALELAESVGDMARLGAGYNNLGNLQKRMGDARKALKSYRQAARTFERVGDRAGLVTVHYSQAELLRERGELGRALEHVDAAEQLADAIGGGFREQALKRTRLVRGGILLSLGQLEAAAPLLEQSWRDAEARGDREAALIAELALAEVSLRRGETAEVERRCAELAQRAVTGRLDIAVYHALNRLHQFLGHHYGAAYVERCRARGQEVLGTALLDVSLAAIPPGGATILRGGLEEAVQLLEAAGRGMVATNARRVLLELGAGAGERLELLNGVMDVLQHLSDRRRVLANLVSLAARVLRAERGLLLYRRNEGDMVDFTALHGMNLGEAQRASEQIINRVAESRGPVIVADALEDPSLIGSASIQDLQIRSVLGLLVERDAQGMWILYLDHRELPGVFTPESRPLLERLSQLAASLLKEMQWRETMLARVESPETSGSRYGMVGRSRAIERVRDYIDNLGKLKLVNENLLFIGESGTGKELVARAVHQVVGAGREMPFIAQSCADIPAELIESTLFGHRRGAYTGASEDRPGIFELANGGVLFLDEIGELPLNLQASLLRVLEERTVARIGEPEKTRPLSLIVVCATNRDLSREVEAGRFRRDLFHRLNQVFRLPPLRERREDILPLLRHFMAQVEDFGGQSPDDLFAAEVLLWFHDHPWPGNIRELKNIVEAIPVRIKARRREQVTLEDLGIRPLTKGGGRVEPAGDPPPAEETLKDFTERMEAGYIRRIMEASDWDITTAAARLGLTYQGLRKRLIRYDWMDEVERKRR